MSQQFLSISKNGPKSEFFWRLWWCMVSSRPFLAPASSWVISWVRETTPINLVHHPDKKDRTDLPFFFKGWNIIIHVEHHRRRASREPSLTTRWDDKSGGCSFNWLMISDFFSKLSVFSLNSWCNTPAFSHFEVNRNGKNCHFQPFKSTANWYYELLESCRISASCIFRSSTSLSSVCLELPAGAI